MIFFFFWRWHKPMYSDPIVIFHDLDELVATNFVSSWETVAICKGYNGEFERLKESNLFMKIGFCKESQHSNIEQLWFEQSLKLKVKWKLNKLFIGEGRKQKSSGCRRLPHPTVSSRPLTWYYLFPNNSIYMGLIPKENLIGVVSVFSNDFWRHATMDVGQGKENFGRLVSREEGSN